MIHITEVMDYLTEPELLGWMLRTPKARREKSSEDSLLIGSEVDRLIQIDLGLPSITKPQQTIPASLAISIENSMKAWGQFKQDRPDIITGIKAIQVELEHDGMLGHPDAFFEDDNRWGIIDFKTSRTMYPRYWTQTAQYTELKRFSHHLDTYIRKPRFIAILRLDKETGKPHYLEICDEGQIAYEVGVFGAYRVAYEHNQRCREFIRQQLELEILK